MSKTDQSEKGKRRRRQMTVVHIRAHEGADYIDVVFLESARFYKLSKKNAAYDEALKLLRDALANRRTLEIRTSSVDSDVIEEVHEHGPGASERSE